MPRSDHVTSFKDAYHGLRTDQTMTLDEKVAFIARARHVLSNLLREAREFQESQTAQQLNANLQAHIDALDGEEE